MVELDELLDVEHLRVVPRGARVQPGDHGRHVAEDGCVHERCVFPERKGEEKEDYYGRQRASSPGSTPPGAA